MAHQSSKVTAFVTKLSPEPPEPVDTNPSDIQPPGIDEEPGYNSLEEALLGE
tara:strand:+ start:351 stop:506 length:156 start_codon:yes stop_codon:yes gene_type:complete